MVVTMPWWNLLKRKGKQATSDRPPAAPPWERPAGSMPVPPPANAAPVIGRRPPVDRDSPEARARRRQRLERRIADLRYDIGQAEDAQAETNRWTERVAGINAAIEQARRDAEAILAAPPGWVPRPLPPWPVAVDAVRSTGPDTPAEVRFRVGEVAFRYSEELDWAERGHQVAEPELRRVEGEVERLLPGDIPPERRDELREHLAHGLSTLAEGLRDGVLDGHAPPSLTLAELASPCPRCGGWRDLKGRCPACQEREWAAERLRADAERLVHERNQQLEELARMRERLPLLRRQLAEAEAVKAQSDK
jgi:hypothetical protein